MLQKIAYLILGSVVAFSLFALFAATCNFAPAPKSMLQQGPTQFYAHFRSTNNSLVHVITTDTTGTWKLAPVLTDSTRPTSETAKSQQAVAAINGGYFNLKDGKSASYVIIDGEVVGDPTKNEALVNNPKLQPHLDKIFNRSEFRILTDARGETRFTITPHNAELAEGDQLVHSLQAGPQLLPTVTDEEEAFVRQDPDDGHTVDSIGSRRNAARTAIGIRPDGTVIFVAVAGQPQDSSSPGMTLRELANVMKQLGCVQALNFDGGTSTTMFVHPIGDSYGVTACGKKPETHVKSVLLLLRK